MRYDNLKTTKQLLISFQKSFKAEARSQGLSNKEVNRMYMSQQDISNMSKQDLKVFDAFWKEAFKKMTGYSEEDIAAARRELMRMGLTRREYENVNSEEALEKIIKAADLSKLSAPGVEDKDIDSSKFGDRRKGINDRSDTASVEATKLFEEARRLGFDPEVNYEYDSYKVVDYIYNLAESSLTEAQKLELLRTKLDEFKVYKKSMSTTSENTAKDYARMISARKTGNGWHNRYSDDDETIKDIFGGYRG